MSDLFDEAANHGLIRVEKAREIHEFELERSIALDRVLRIPPPGRILLRDDEAGVERLAGAIWDADALGLVERGPWDDAPEVWREDYWAMSRAVIAGLREGL